MITTKQLKDLRDKLLIENKNEEGRLQYYDGVMDMFNHVQELNNARQEEKSNNL